MDKNRKTARRYGLEIEFSGLRLEEVAHIIQTAAGGTIIKNHKTHFTVTGTRVGDFIVELDVELAQKISQKAQAHQLERPGELSMESLADMFLPEMLSQVAPTELVSPPLRPADFPVMGEIIQRLRAAGALGTTKSIFFAFGYHINAELAEISPAHILGVLRAYAGLYDWLSETIHMDISRKISGYAAPYEKHYLNHILKPRYAPDMTQLIRDYIWFNPGRNYALDLLPLFRHIAPVMTGRLADTHLTKPRPTWHFRMPNCEIDRPGWDFEKSIDIWHAVEEIAENPAALELLLASYHARNPDVLSGIDPAHVENCQSIINNVRRAHGG